MIESCPNTELCWINKCHTRQQVLGRMSKSILKQICCAEPSRSKWAAFFIYALHSAHEPDPCLLVRRRHHLGCQAKEGEAPHLGQIPLEQLSSPCKPGAQIDDVWLRVQLSLPQGSESSNTIFASRQLCSAKLYLPKRYTIRPQQPCTLHGHYLGSDKKPSLVASGSADPEGVAESGGLGSWGLL